MLEEEVYGANSPIWDVDFAQNAVHGPATNGAGKSCDSKNVLICLCAIQFNLSLNSLLNLTCVSVRCVNMMNIFSYVNSILLTFDVS